MTPPYNVLFLCTGNSARSILAEAILNKLGHGRFAAFSAGSDPKGHVHAQTLALLRERGFETAPLRSNSWEEFSRSDAANFDVVITVCDNAAGEACPLFPGHPIRAHWGVADPALATGTEAEVRLAFVNAFDALSRRISDLMALPLGSMERTDLQQQLNAIGRTDDAGATLATAT
ncbi:MAG: arsenate reductase ArsC [Candidatus Sulfotelmatobacter sp.]